MRVFLSYSRRDTVDADRMVADLEARGIEVDIDRRDLLEQVARRKAEFFGQCETGYGGIILQPGKQCRAVNGRFHPVTELHGDLLRRGCSLSPIIVIHKAEYVRRFCNARSLPDRQSF
jgi:hypothetical protein